MLHLHCVMLGSSLQTVKAKHCVSVAIQTQRSEPVLYVLVCECYLFESSWLMCSGRLFLVGYLPVFSGP